MAEKVYCTKCGREIKSGLLYCDRCGQSVKKSREQQSKNKSNRKQAEQIHREQINRKKRRQEKEIKKQEKRRKATRRAAVVGVIVGILIIGVISASVAYIWMSNNSNIKSVTDVVNEDIAQTAPSSTDTQTTVSTSSTNAATSFLVFEYSGISCPYPSSFTQQAASGGELLHLADTTGGAVMIISRETAAAADTGEAARTLMADYYDRVSTLGMVSENRSGSDWYIVTYETDTQIVHRKCVIASSTALYYDFTYDKTSAKAGEYAGYIENLDETFTAGQDNQ